jgi:Flp pilus assembly protein TadD
MRRRYCLVAVALVFSISLGCQVAAHAEPIEAAPGIVVSRKAFPAPVNEQPFYGFREKTPQQRAADAALLASVDAGPGRVAAVQRLLDLGLQALATGDFGQAARRYNQAYLLQPGRGEIYHGFAAVAEGRFKDAAFAEELFQIALKLKPGEAAIQADYARFLLIQKRAGEAVPLLEAAVRNPRAQAQHWSNLGFGYAQTGRLKEACESLRVAESKGPPAELRSDLGILRQIAAC